ncbi:MAG: hypothetical protein ACFFG0_02140 [Candidatus Thorarchaeota archaeon]
MTLASSSLVPEFQYYFYNFIVSSLVNKYEIPAPVPVDETFLESGTVVELLCNETFSYDTYTYLYKNEDRKQCWPTLTRQRLMIYPSSKYYIPDASGDNIFNLQTHDFLMLNALLQYRHDSTSLTIVDSTANQLVTDSTSNTAILYTNFGSLNTPLSKLIYLYLDLKIYDNYSNYNNLTLITTGSLLETCFELKLIDEYFLFMTNREVSFEITCST